MIVLDTSFLISFFNEADENHGEAVNQMKHYESKNERFLVNEHVISETSTVLLYKTGMKKASFFLDFIKNTENFHPYFFGPDDFDNITGLFVKQKNQLSFADASVIYLAASTKSRLASFDKNQKKEFSRYS